MSNRLIAALDIGSRQNSGILMNSENGQILFELKKLSNNLPGTRFFWEKATQLFEEYSLEGVDFVMESSGPYWFGSYWWLQDKCSTRESFSVTALNSQIVAGFRSKFSHKKQKTDRKDARTIADRFRFGRFDPVYAPRGSRAVLRLYTRHRLRTVKNLVASKAFFVSLLFLKMSEYARYCKHGREDRLFANVFGAASSRIIAKYQSAEELAKAPLSELASLIETASKGRIVDAPGRAAIARKMAQDSYPLLEEAKEPINFILDQTTALIRFLEDQIKEVDERIEPILESIDDPIKSVPGIGPVFAAGIIAEVGDLRRFRGQPSVASYVGIIPSMDDSGDFQSSLNHMTKTGNAYARYYYIEAANSLRTVNPVFKEYFQKKLAETSPRRFKRALGHTARKLIRMHYAMVMKNETFNIPSRAA